MNIRQILLLPALATLLFSACQQQRQEESVENTPAEPAMQAPAQHQQVYAPFTLTTDVSRLTEAEKQMIPLLIEASKIMDDLFWKVAFGDDPQAFLQKIEDPELKELAQINYGPWDRLGGDSVFVPGYPPKSPGANFYPSDITKRELEQAELEGKSSLYTLLRRDESGALNAVPYHEAFAEELRQAADYLKQAAALTEDEGLRNYLELRAGALVTGEYLESDMAWMNMKNNGIDVVIGPIETYEDQLTGAKAAFEAYVLVKDKEWSQRLGHYAALLPDMQRGLPVEEQYKREMPGTDSDLNAYDVIYYAGDCNAGSKTIAINLPNDERVQLEKGTRRLQLKNAMQAKFEKILVPISEMLIAKDQRKHITFNAFFGNTMFHEVAHGLGIKNLVNSEGTVREALKEQASALEEGKADILGLYLVTKLFEQGEIAEGEVMDNYVTFLAGIFRSVRFGASSAHGKANMMRFNYFQEKQAFERDEATGTYRVNFEKMQQAMDDLSALILTLQGDGDYEGVKKLMDEKGVLGEQLQADLNRLAKAGIPVDIVFEQGLHVLEL